MTSPEAGTELWQQVYELLSEVTPLTWDCGRLCGAACCQQAPGETNEPGMLLYPGEDKYLLTAAKGAIHLSKPGKTAGEGTWWAYLKETERGKLFVCQGREEQCRRELRPFACRIFPLAPFLVDDILLLDLDPAGVHLCPLIQSGKSKWEILDHHFVWQVRKAFSILLPFEAIRRHVRHNTHSSPHSWHQEPWVRLFLPTGSDRT